MKSSLTTISKRVWFVTMNCLLFLLCVCSLTLQANGFSQYYVKPTEPVNSSCPGQPCLTLDEYNTGRHFIYSNNSVFIFMSGIHAISRPVYVTYSFNMTFERCHECNGTSTEVRYNSSMCVGTLCTAFWFYNATNIVFRNINITAVLVDSATGDGIQISYCTNISLDSVSISITDIYGNFNRHCVDYAMCKDVNLISTVNASLVNVNFNIGILMITNSMNIFAKCVTLGSSSYGQFSAWNTKNITIYDMNITGDMYIYKVKNMELKNIKWKVKNVFGTSIEDSKNIVMEFKEIIEPDQESIIINTIEIVYRSEVYIHNTIFTGFTSVSKYQRYNTLEGIIVVRESTLQLHNCTFSNNSIPNIAVKHSVISFSGFVTFINNTAYRGPCLHISTESEITTESNSSVLFSNNHALSVGGVFYANIGQTKLSKFRPYSPDGKGLTFYNNSARISGDVLYVRDLNHDNTYHLHDIFEHHSEIYPNDSLSIISSEPTRVCVCDYTNHPDCFKLFFSFTVYPGQTISLTAVITGQNFGTSSGSIYAQFLNKNNVTLGQYQYSQAAEHTQCNQLRYTIFSPPIENNVLFLTVTAQSQVQIMTNEMVEMAIDNYNSVIMHNAFYGKFGNRNILYFSVQINITVQPCPIGFTLSQPPHRCICGPIFSKLGAKCYLQTQSFVRSGMLWIGFEIDNTTVIVSEECRFFLCKESEINVTVTEPDNQCNFNHSGTLCGSCQEGLSLALGSWQCLHCSNQYLALLVPFAVAGFVLVFAIKTLDITVATGYVNGLVLYFNTIHTIWFVLQNPQNRNPILAAIVAWTNLDLGIETCFFDGLTAYSKTCLQFLFPLYLWAISGAMILLAKYSRRMTRMMGSNPVSVLATIFLLSYTKLLRNCASSMFYSTVVYSSTTKTVWAVDGSIEYLGHQHLPLFIVALCVLLFLCLPYTLLLVLGQWLYKIENRIVSHVMFRIKPIMDAYFGPLKDKHRYWAGMLLLSRAIIEISISIVPDPSIDNILLSTSILAVFLSLMSGYAKGFYNNHFVTVFEVTLLLNLAVFSLTKIYSQSDAQLIVDNIFTAAGIVQFFSLIIYRFVVLFKPLYRGPCRVNPLSKCFKRGQDEGDDDWNQFEEAVLMREIPEPEHEDSEESASLDSLPTY